MTVYPYLFIAISLTLACVSLYMLAVGLRTFEALYMITVFEGFMIISGSISGNIVMDEKEGQPTYILCLYVLAIGVILVGLYVLCSGERAADGQDPTLLTRSLPPSDEAGREMMGTGSSSTRDGDDGGRVAWVGQEEEATPPKPGAPAASRADSDSPE